MAWGEPRHGFGVSMIPRLRRRPCAVKRWGGEKLEDEAVRRGVEGVERGIYHNGKRIATECEYSDTLLIFLLKGAMPEKYRERRETMHTISPALEELRQQWQDQRDHPEPLPPRRALPVSHEDYIDAEAEEPPRTPHPSGRPGRRSNTMDLLDRLNGTGPYGGRPEEEDD